MPSTVLDQPPVTSRQAWWVFVLLFLLYMFDYIDRLIIVSLFPFLKADWGLTDTQCGLLVSAVYWSILIFSFPSSLLVDRWSRKKSIGLMGLVWSLATLACGFARSFGQLFTARALIGVGEAGYAPGGTAMISAFFSEKSRARILGCWNASIPLGSALGMVIGGFVAERFGWRQAFGLVAAPGMILALLFFWVRDYRTVDLVRIVKRGDETARIKMKRLDAVREFSRNPTLIFNNLAFAANVLVTTSLLTWLPTYLSREYGLPMSQAGLKGGLVMMTAVIGAPLGGHLADRWLARRPEARLLFPALSSLAAGLLLFMAFGLLRGPSQYMVLLVSGGAAVAFVPAAVAVTQDVVHPGLRATSLSLNVIIQHLLGSSLGPIFVGAISDAQGLNTALLYLPAFCLLAAGLFFAGSFFYVGDATRARAAELSF
ncbi:MAG: MFS transporter [Thermodesulfobacteriota bacterium]